MDFTSIITTITNFFSSNSTILYGLYISLGFILFDTLLGYLLAYKEGTFDWSKVPNFVSKNLFPYIGGLLLLAFFALINSDLESVFWIATAGVSVKFGKEIIMEKVKKLFGIGIDTTNYEKQITELKSIIEKLQSGSTVI
jgi:hypothetical protein